jgi:SAM-dependent methyltransferase
MLYDTLARFYDLENADFTDDLEFWVRLAKERGGPVLELGCGTGRVTQQIARAGCAIVGLDNSEAMLALARAKLARAESDRNASLAARVTLVLGDMTDFEIPISQIPKSQSSVFNLQSSIANSPILQFSLIICPFNTFMHLLTPGDQLAMLACARKHLKPGGRLVLDLTNPGPVYVDGDAAGALTPQRTFRDEERNLTIQQFSTFRLERTWQLAHIQWQYDAVSSADGTVTRTLAPMTLRYTFPAEMGLLLERTGFKLARFYGDWAESPLTDDSERMIVVAEAKD